MSTNGGTAGRQPKGVDGYLASLPPDRRAALEKLRRTIKAAAPKAVETFSYRMPVFKYLGMLVGFASFQDHLSFVVMSTGTVKAHREELEGYETTAGGVHFTVEKPLPESLVSKLVLSRVAENEERDRKRRLKKGS